MASQNLHLPHKQEEKLINEVTEAIANPDKSPVMFNVWGICGVGKSTLLTKFQEGLTDKDKKIHFAKISFDTAYSTPLDVMVALHKDLPEINGLQKDLFAKDPFSEKYETYNVTLADLNATPVEDKGKVESDQIDRVKQLIKLLVNAGISLGKTALSSGISNPMTDLAASVTTAAVGNVLDVTIDGATSALSLKDKLMDDLLLKHRATKKSEVRELMLEPLPKLTQAFIDSLISHAAKTPIVLILDTYEKASIEFDAWLRQLFLKHHKALKNSKLRIVSAGRSQLFKKEGWRNFVTTEHLVDEISLKEFDKDKIKLYLDKIGFSDKREIEKLCKRTNGLPYHLKLIAKQKDEGIAINCDEAVEKRLLVGLTETQQNFVRLAACCRWFDRSLIQSLAEWRGLDFSQGVDASLNCFDWLKNLDFVEFIDRGRYRLGDVARDVIRLSLSSDELKDNHARLQKYFENLADREVPSKLWDGEKYENSVWCEYTAEAIYHAFFSLRRDACKIYFLKHFFASSYFKQISVVISPPIASLISEAEFDENIFPQENKKFLDIVKVLLPLGWVLIDSSSPHEIKFGENSLPKAVLERIENSIERALEKVDALPDGLAKWQALMCKCHHSPRNRIFDILKKAEEQAKLLENQIKPSDCSNLFRCISDYFYSLSKYKEAITNLDKAIERNPDDASVWSNRGIAKTKLQRYEVSISDFDNAIERNPDDANAWRNRGTAKIKLQRYEEAIADLDKAIELDLDDAGAWNNRGVAKINLQRYKEAIADLDKAIELDPDDAGAWNNRGVAKTKLQRYEEAIANLDKAIGLDPDNANYWFSRGAAKLQLQKYEEAIADYDKAIALNLDYANAWNKRGKALTRLGQYDQALENFNRAIQLDSNDLNHQINRGVLFAWMGRQEEAIRECDSLLQSHPNDVNALYGLSCCYALQGNIDQSIKYLAQAISHQPEETKSRAKKDPEFNGIREDKRFQDLVDC